MRSVTSARCDTASLGLAPRAVAFFAAVSIARNSGSLGSGRERRVIRTSKEPRYPRFPSREVVGTPLTSAELIGALRLRIVRNIFPMDAVMGLGFLLVRRCPPFLLTDREVDVPSPLPKPLLA
jgi:hypothetical protein